MIGLWSDESEVVDKLVEGTMRQRETRGLRQRGNHSFRGAR